VGGLLLVGSSACSHDYAEVTTTEAAAAEFSRVREQLGKQDPLVEVKDDGATVIHRSPVAPTSDIQSFHTLVYEMPSRKLLRVNMPFWAMRHLRSSGFRYLGQFYFLEDTEFDPIRVELSLEDVERHGPGLLVDQRRSNGAQFLAWVD
jgi:hypothetical protein